MLYTCGRERGDLVEHPQVRPAEDAGLLFQTCRWCHTPAFRRSLCATCGSTELEWRRSAGTGTVVRRTVPVSHNTSIVAMDEGFTLVCQVTGVPPEAVTVRARVRVVRATEPGDPGLPVVELCEPPVPAGLWR